MATKTPKSFLQSIPFHLITLHGNDKRLNSVQAVLESVGFQYTVHTFDRHPTDRSRGCYESHMSLFRYAQANDLPYIAILEDNIRLASDEGRGPVLPSDEQYQFMKDRLIGSKKDDDEDWEIMIFGGCTMAPIVFSVTSDPYVLSGNGTFGNFGYVISKAGYLRFLDLYHRLNVNHMPIDFLMQESEHAAPNKVLLMTPMLFVRDLRIGSIISPFLDPWRPFVFSPVMQRRMFNCGAWCAEHHFTTSPFVATLITWSLLITIVLSLLKLFFYVCTRLVFSFVSSSSRGRRTSQTVF